MGRHFSAECLWVGGLWQGRGGWGVEVLALKSVVGWSPYLSLAGQRCTFSIELTGYPLPRHTNNKTVTHQSECQVINLH